MNDTTDPSTSKPTEVAKTAKKAGLLRKSAIILFLVLIVLVILAFPFAIEPWIISKAKATLAAQGYQIDKDSAIDLSVLGGKFSAENLKVSQEYKGQTDQIFSAKTLSADVAMIDSLMTFDLIVDHLIIDEMTANLRRRPDGTVPVIPPPEDGEGTDWSKVDWKKYYEKWRQRREKKKEEQEKQEEEQKKDPDKRPEPEKKQAPDWKDATVYKPAPAATQSGSSRVLIRDLKINGKNIGLPDETAFDLSSFDITGTNVTLTQDDHEDMKLTAKLVTTGAGPIDIDLSRAPGANGSLNIKADKLPIEALANDRIAGDAVSKYGASGFDQLNLTTSWKGEDLTGELNHLLTKFKLNPTSDAGSEAKQAAQIVNGMDGKPIVWPMKIGGSPLVPTITDSGVDELVKANAAGAVKGAVKQKATEEAGKLLDKQGGKNPATKKATDLLKGLGN
jgi:hypothetical protein